MRKIFKKDIIKVFLIVAALNLYLWSAVLISALLSDLGYPQIAGYVAAFILFAPLVLVILKYQNQMINFKYWLWSLFGHKYEPIEKLEEKPKADLNNWLKGDHSTK